MLCGLAKPPGMNPMERVLAAANSEIIRPLNVGELQNAVSEENQ